MSCLLTGFSALQLVETAPALFQTDGARFEPSFVSVDYVGRDRMTSRWSWQSYGSA